MEELLYELACQLFKVDSSDTTYELLQKVKKLNKNKYNEALSGLDIDDLVSKKPKKKRLNSGVKGKTGERELVKIFNERFKDLLEKNKDWGEFHRVVGSGNRWSQAHLSKNSEQLYSGDILCQNLKFVIESKNGYDDIDLVNLFYDGDKELDSFLEQVTDDSNRSGKAPLLIWKKTRKQRLAFLNNQWLENRRIADGLSNVFVGINTMPYKDWTILSFKDLLTFPDNFFFEIKEQI